MSNIIIHMQIVVYNTTTWSWRLLTLYFLTLSYFYVFLIVIPVVAASVACLPVDLWREFEPVRVTSVARIRTVGRASVYSITKCSTIALLREKEEAPEKLICYTVVADSPLRDPHDHRKFYLHFNHI